VSDVAEAAAFYADVLGIDIAMDLGWIGTCVVDGASEVQLSVLTQDATGPVNPAVSVGVTDLDAVYERAVAAGADIVYPPTVEPWGVRRFFLRDASGNVVNVVAHQ
jgi:predicted enzyme related to lactoylglutathione lyase